MYTGLIFYSGKVESIEPRGEGKRIVITAPKTFLKRVDLGSSVNVNGICFTVIAKTRKNFSADVLPQTVNLTTISDWQIGTILNLEPSLSVGSELGGHFVYGHVDGIGIIDDLNSIDSALRVSITLPEKLRIYVAEQGSVAIDGISLTVAELTKTGLEVELIPETQERTNAHTWQINSRVNVEVDMMMKYIERMLDAKSL